MNAGRKRKIGKRCFFILEAEDNSTLIHAFVQNRTAQRQIACGQKRSKSSQELNGNFAVQGSILDFTLSSAGLIYSVWQKYRGSTPTEGARAQLELSLMLM